MLDGASFLSGLFVKKVPIAVISAVKDRGKGLAMLPRVKILLPRRHKRQRSQGQRV